MINKASLRSGGAFFLASIVAAGFNYLYQVAASQSLSEKAFADLNGWSANLAPFLILGGLMQYFANFRPVSLGSLRKGAAAIVVLAIVAAGAWSLSSDPFSTLHSMIVIVFAVMLGWLLGQAQIRLQFFALALGNLGMGIGRYGAAIFPFEGDRTMQFAFANVVASSIAAGILIWCLWRAKEVDLKSPSVFWQGAVIMSIVGAMIPQFDMLLMNHTQGESAFSTFVRASLFGRAVYAVTSILAQWLLPNQIRGQTAKLGISIWKIVGAGLILCAAVAWLSPWIAEFIFRWESYPPRTLVFLASAEISLLAVFLVYIQAGCAKRDTRRPLFLLGLLGLEAVIQLIGQFPMIQFLSAAVTLQAAALIYVSKSTWRK